MIGSKAHLREIIFHKDDVKDWNEYPFNVPVIKSLNSLQFKKKICFFVGENGSGKSTLLEAIAIKYSFGKEGGSRNIHFSTSEEDKNPLSEHLQLIWGRKILHGYFMRAQTFFNVASYLDQLKKEVPGQDPYGSYGGKSLHKRSHGQSFLTLFTQRFSGNGFYILDEPEAALSPQKQLSLLLILNNLIQENPETQFIIATHSPILLAYPDAQIFSFDGNQIEEITYKDTEAYQVTHNFLMNPELYLKKLLDI